MKIVTWNCNGALRKKVNAISKLDADIYVVQECEDPSRSSCAEYKKWASNHLWIGDSKNKGVGIFASEQIKLDKLEWSNKYLDHTVKYFLPCEVNEDFQLIGVWTHKNNSPNFGYIGQLWKYLEVNLNKINKGIILGDFNSNTKWDEWDRWWNHSDVVTTLNSIGLSSLYHRQYKEKQGSESKPTFFLQKKLEKPYHIDYVFMSESLIKNNGLVVGLGEDWLEHSDHVPLCFSL